MNDLPKLKYCCHSVGQTGSCANVAKYHVKLCPRKDKPEAVKISSSYRCEEHKASGTTGKKVFETTPFDQTNELLEINNYLKSLIGKTIKSKVHTANGLEVKYIKDNGAIMCFQPITKKWKYVYYNQITEVFQK